MTYFLSKLSNFCFAVDPCYPRTGLWLSWFSIFRFNSKITDLSIMYMIACIISRKNSSYDFDFSELTTSIIFCLRLSDIFSIAYVNSRFRKSRKVIKGIGLRKKTSESFNNYSVQQLFSRFFHQSLSKCLFVAAL